MLHPKIDEHVNPSVEMHHLVGKLSTAEILLRPDIMFQHVQVNKCFVIRERLYAHPVVHTQRRTTVGRTPLDE
jgi:hypothetical protein